MRREGKGRGLRMCPDSLWTPPASLSQTEYIGAALSLVKVTDSCHVPPSTLRGPGMFAGLWLMPTADINVGALVPSMLPLRATKPNPNNPHSRIQADKTMLLFGTTNGSIGYLLPIAEDKYRRCVAAWNLVLPLGQMEAAGAWAAGWTKAWAWAWAGALILASSLRFAACPPSEPRYLEVANLHHR